MTGFYLSTNSLLDASDVRLGSRTRPASAAGASNARDDIRDAAGRECGHVVPARQRRRRSDVTETLETNNTRSVSLLVGPDLTSPRSRHRSRWRHGSTVTVGDSVKNIGAADAGASVIRFYLSPDALLSTNDQLLGSRDVPALAAGLTSSGTTSIVIPAGLSGTYYLFAVADGTSAVAEASESNNNFLRVIQITQ